MLRLEIKLLGPPSITLDGIEMATDRHKAIGLLAYLAVETKPHPREALAALLWPDYPRASALSYLRRTLWELNQALGKGWINADREQVALEQPPGLEVDVQAFQRLLAQETEPTGALSQAVALYREDFLKGLVIADTAPFEAWQSEQSEFYRRQFTAALERLVAAYEKDGEYALALPYAQRWLALDTLDEAAARAVMRQLAGMGDRRGAIRVYQACQETLREELGISPQADTEALYQAILQGEAPEHPRVTVQPAVRQAATGSLPAPATPFIGRAAEIEQILRLVEDPGTRLLTLTGPGGTGKTRLSIQVAAGMAAQEASSFPDGAWFIALATVESLPGLIQAIAKGLNFSFLKEEISPRQQLLNYLRQKRMLLVLDNFEQLADAGRELVVEMVEAAPGVKLLITSRQRLNLQSERIFRVSGMRTPELDVAAGWDDLEAQAKPYSAIQLLLERARRVRPDFHLNRENLGAVAQICRLVEGSPLGIELAVAWLELLSPEQIAREIARSLDFLASEAADIPARQHSLRAVFETSWNLLEPEEQRALRQLCVFSGSFSPQAAQQVSGCTLRTLLRLANKSWLQPLENERYVLHELLRQYGLERLRADQDEWRETQNRQAEFFANFVQDQDAALRSAGQFQARQALIVELESNIPAAWDWLEASGQIEVLIEKMLPGLFKYCWMQNFPNEFIPRVKSARQSVPVSVERQHLQQRAILETVETFFEMNAHEYLDQPKERLEKLWAMVKEFALEDELQGWYIVLVITYGSFVNYEEGFQQIKQAIPKVQTWQDPWILGICYLYGSPSHIRSENELYKKHLLEALAIFRKLGVVYEQGVTLLNLGSLAVSEKDYPRAIEYIESSRPLFRQIGTTQDYIAFWNLAECYLSVGSIDKALLASEEIRAIAENTGNQRLLGEILSWKSRVLGRYGSLEQALEYGQTSLELAKKTANQNDIAWHAWELGEIYRLMGEVQTSIEYYQQALPFFEGIQDYIGLGFYYRGLGDIALMQCQWAEAREWYQQALAVQEKELRSHRTWGLAVYHARLGGVLVRLGAFAEAKQHLRAALALAEQWVFPDVKALPLNGVASLLAATGLPAQAIEVAACVISQPTTWNEVKHQAQAILEAAWEALPEAEAQLARQRGQAASIDEVSRVYLASPLLGV
jgi:predicted ATPase/DNA-binding SARP family transcriptional activator